MNFGSSAFRALEEAQRAMARIGAMLESPSVGIALRDFERASRLLAEHQTTIERQLAAFNAVAPSIQSYVDNMNTATSATALAGLRLSLADADIQAVMDRFTSTLRVVPPDLMSRLRLNADASERIQALGVSLRETDGWRVSQAIEAALRNAPAETRDAFAEVAESEVLTDIAAELDDVAGQLLDYEERRPAELMATQRVWLGIIMVVLIWFLTLNEQDGKAGQELHTIAQSVIGSAILWAIIRDANGRPQ